MTYDSEYRIALALGVAALVIVGGWYRLKSQTAERLDRRQEGWPILIGLRLTAAIALATIVTYLIAPTVLCWAKFNLPPAWRWFGFALAACSGLLKTWTFQTLGKNLTDTVVTRKQHSLVTNGPYRWVRHPFYTSFALDVIGVSMLTDNALILGLGTIVFATIAIRTRQEEVHLEARFGEAYRAYRNSVGAFLPKMRLAAGKNHSET